MPFTPGDAVEIARSAAARIAANSDRSTPYTRRELADALEQAFPGKPGATRTAFENIAARAFEAAAAAQVMQDEPGLAVQPFNLPLDRSLIPSEGAFGYRVIVRCTLSGGGSIDTPVTVYSDTPLTGDQISQLGLSGLGDQLPEYHGAGTQSQILQTTCVTEIVTAGRSR